MCRTHVLLLALQQAAGALLTCWLLYADPASPRGLRAGRELVLMVFLVQPVHMLCATCSCWDRRAARGRRWEEGMLRRGELLGLLQLVSPFILFPIVGIFHSSPQNQFCSLFGHNFLLWF